MSWLHRVSNLASSLLSQIWHSLAKFGLIKLVIILGAFVELGMLSFLKGIFNAYIASFLILASGLVVGIAFIYQFYDKECSIPKPVVRHQQTTKKNLYLIGIFLLGLMISGILANREFNKFIIEDFYTVSGGSDVIPQIGVIIDRFLSGEFPYRWIYADDWGFHHHLFPTYLPLTWMPFIIPDLIGLDYRWFAFAVLGVSFALFCYYFIRRSPPFKQRALLAALPFLFLIPLILFDHEGMFRYSVETQIVGFYLLVGMALLSKSILWRALALLLCVLSRYSLVLWIPLFLLVLLFREPKRNALIIGGLLGLGILVIYVLPFLSQDWTIYKQGYDYHTNAAFASWELMPWQQPNERPFALYKGLGFGWWFYENLDGALADKVNAYRYFHAAASGGTVLLMSFLFWRLRNRIDYRIFLLGSFKIYLVIFYNFIQIPFGYLFMVPIILSLPIIGLTLLAKDAPRLVKIS